MSKVYVYTLFAAVLLLNSIHVKAAVVNGSFENGLTGWSSSSNGGYVTTISGGTDGSYCAYLSATAENYTSSYDY
ncbi:MAG: hypothetical protein ABSA77_02540 [Thermoguttaceae bacterium]|jgi:pectate lyase